MTQNQTIGVRAEPYFPHIDIFKGIVILLVIVGHIVQNSFLGGGRDHQLYIWIYTFHMPAFFFCFGFLNRTDISDFATVRSYFVKKTCRILIPYLTWGAIMFLYSQKQINLASFFHYILLKPGYGLWFLQALFKYFILSAIVMFLINKALWRWGKWGLMSAFFAICCLISIAGKISFLIDWNFVWFFLGMIAHQSSKVYDFFTNKLIATIFAVAFFASIYLKIPQQIVALTGMITILNISLIRFKKGKVLDWLICFGKNTMPIFLLHFFLLGKYKLNIPIDNPVVVFCILMLISIVIALICLATYRALSFGYLPTFLWGEKNDSQ